MAWTWDPRKDAANRAKHGVSFALATLVFEDPLHLSRPDPFPDEERWQTLGMVGPACLFVVHAAAWEGDEPGGRIISARKATRKERSGMKKANKTILPAALQAEAEAVAALPDDAIDLSDSPETVDWSDAERGRFYRPVKQQLTLRLDADVVHWFRTHARGGGYQTRINQALRDYVATQRRKRA